MGQVFLSLIPGPIGITQSPRDPNLMDESITPAHFEDIGSQAQDLYIAGHIFLRSQRELCPKG